MNTSMSSPKVPYAREPTQRLAALLAAHVAHRLFGALSSDTLQALRTCLVQGADPNVHVTSPQFDMRSCDFKESTTPAACWLLDPRLNSDTALIHAMLDQKVRWNDPQYPLLWGSLVSDHPLGLEWVPLLLGRGMPLSHDTAFFVTAAILGRAFSSHAEEAWDAVMAQVGPNLPLASFYPELFYHHLNAGAWPEQSDQWAVWLERCQALGAKFDQHDGMGSPALFETTQPLALLAAGADPNVRHHDARTPLHYYAMLQEPEVTQALLAKGAKVNAQEADGETPAHVAARYLERDAASLGMQSIALNILQQLMHAGADLDLPSRTGDSVRDVLREEYASVLAVEDARRLALSMQVQPQPARRPRL